MPETDHANDIGGILPSRLRGVDREASADLVDVQALAAPGMREGFAADGAVWGMKRGRTRITGVVRDGLGRPPGGASVIVVSSSDKGVVTTDAAGYYDVSVQWSLDAADGWILRLKAWKAGFEARESQASATTALFGRKDLKCDFALQEGATVIGRVQH